MAERKMDLRLDLLREDIRDAVKGFAEKIISGLGDNLQSITVVGSSLTEDFVPGRSDINSVLVLGGQNLHSLKNLAEMGRAMGRRRLAAPLLMTKGYIERSRDVFGVEFLDLQLIHQTIFGDDPFRELSFVKQDVRLQCERELKAMLIRLRQGYIAAAANRKLVRDILASAAGGLTPLLRAMLWLKGIDRPRQAEKLFEKSAGEFSLGMDSLAAVRRWRHSKTRLDAGEITASFEAVYNTVERLSVIVDELEV